MDRSDDRTPLHQHGKNRQALTYSFEDLQRAIRKPSGSAIRAMSVGAVATGSTGAVAAEAAPVSVNGCAVDAESPRLLGGSGHSTTPSL